MCLCVCVCVWGGGVYGVVVSMFGFHRNDRGSGVGTVKFHNGYHFTSVPRIHPNLGKCLKDTCHMFTQTLGGNLGKWKLFRRPSLTEGLSVLCHTGTHSFSETAINVCSAIITV